MFWQLITLSLFIFGLGEAWARRNDYCSPGFKTELFRACLGFLLLYAGGFFDELILGFYLAISFLRMLHG